ncbi:MAG: Methionyl-tRNA synthetase [candidate division WWE3 bacterium GW2011_GWC1_41_7]|uniref:Methionine--tRNA ligase n=4 Tax=Katanobacteria TaxID=422282 RepID=A0A0G0X7X5_UNCKA|nr:MAG: Methionyl-tRNA synthetase [candidate division WWE3 bacterium GW2011_GWB1_41_6]KKS20805.1 MAG: Methionyl-tRNA synthetase [candidate division WWE3 bacterium GW2011_GWC1_41_7]KKS21139.1 MAG: Methionyl-tRNA synthetase [candidate division WWE3 bacterium GW2011_GWA1_41_8]OGC58402.1 MAG: methionine--tRNA ligase [candidate division WWE3 bacterium RIFCSPLOWO2_01_FULL_41_9]
MTVNNRPKTLITTAIDYTNDVIHIGHAYQKILADCLARYERLRKGEDNVYFLTGTDEYGTTNEKAAIRNEVTPAEHVEEISQLDKEQLSALNISYDRFIRTTDEDHIRTAQEFFQKAVDNGDIYKGIYVGLYCEGCEAYKTLSELNESGQCLLHQTRQIQKLEEENYFFRWSKYTDFLWDLLNKPGFVLPEGKRKEMLAFVEQGISDIPVTRPKYKVSWGIDAPNDPDHVIYVWFDALINYYTAGVQNGFWDEDTRIVHILGKDNARWHALLWPAMLKSVGLRIPDTVYVHGFINLNGEKISKSRGNVILPSDLVEKFGADAVRYYFLKHGPISEDVNVSENRLKEVYNADLANGLGNTVARIAKLAERSGLSFPVTENDVVGWGEEWAKPFTEFRVDLVLHNIWSELADLNKHINENEPWKITGKDKLQEVLDYEVNGLRKISNKIIPFIPNSAKAISEQVNVSMIKSGSVLFPRID